MKTIVLALLLFAPLAAQQVLDRVLIRFDGEIITQLDVRQARLLKLVDAAGEADEAYVDALVNRRLILADLRRSPPSEPASDALEARRREWQERLGTPTNVADLLERAGMSETGLRGWLRDDLRIESYIADRFGGRPADLASWLSVLRQRAGLQ
jgi:hypothetical protein